MKNRGAFTFAETLVIGVVGFLLLGLLMPALNDTQEKLRASQCLSNMRQWGLAFGMYCNDYNDYWPYQGSGGDIGFQYNQTAWYNILTSYIGTSRLVDLYTSNPPRIPFPGVRSIFICPSAAPITNYTPSVAQPYFAYAINRVLNGSFPSPPGQGLKKRGLAVKPGQTVLFCDSEAGVDPTTWNWSFTDGWFINFYRPPRHSGGDNFVFVDGHAEWAPQADYKWTYSYGNNATAEWIIPRKIYWFPCPSCDKR
jgi:prepilin-type processing-associated H-X9-DG protein